MNTMEFKVNRETFSAKGALLDVTTEQSVEKDFVLPDYFPDIFRILKCIVIPEIVSQTINGSKLTFEMSVIARVLYCSENDSKVNCIEQKMNYSKSVDMTDSCANPYVCIVPHCDYVNCRVVNQRRLDIRGAVSVKIKVTGEKKLNVVTDASGCNIQLKKQLITYPSKRLTAAKRVTVIEELELSQSKPPVSSVLRSDCVVKPAEQKVIAGKLVTKGDAEISMLYSCVTSQGENSVESMKFSIPFSQIIDVDGIDETFEANVNITAASCVIIPNADSPSSLECELVLFVNCVAVKYETGNVVTDAYSTCYECELKTGESSLECVPVKVDETHTLSSTANYSDEEICCVYDSWANADNVSVRYDEENQNFVVTGNVKFCVLAKNESGSPIFLETESPFEHEIATPEEISGLCECVCEPCVCVKSCTYHLPDSNNVELKADLSITGTIGGNAAKQLLSELSVCTDKPKQRNDGYALKLCYCSEEDDIWEIAKKYSTSISAIMEENELSDEKVLQHGMLLIPLMN